MANETESEKRKQASIRTPLDKHGNPQDSWLDAKGGSYTVVSEGKTLKRMFADYPKASQAACTYGGWATFAGNQTNTVRAALRAGEDPGQTEFEALMAWDE